MKVNDINGRKKEIESIKKIKHASIDTRGNPVEEDYLEVVVVRKSGRRTKEWWPLSKFVQHNPDHAMVLQ